MRWEGSQRVSKALIQAKASGLHRHGVILTTISSSFSKDDTYTSSLDPCHFLATLKHRAFVCSVELIYYCFCGNVNWLASFSTRAGHGVCQTGFGASLWYWAQLTVYPFMSLQAWEIPTKTSSENTRNLAQQKSMLPSHRITNAVTGSNFKILVSSDKTC